MQEFSVVWTIGVEALDTVDAAKRARALMLDPNNVATCFHVIQVVDMDSLADSELHDRGYECIDLETVDLPMSQGEIKANLQNLLCAKWSQPEQDDYVIPSFLLKRQPETFMEVVIVDPNGIAVVTHRKI